MCDARDGRDGLGPRLRHPPITPATPDEPATTPWATAVSASRTRLDRPPAAPPGSVREARPRASDESADQGKDTVVFVRHFSTKKPLTG